MLYGLCIQAYSPAVGYSVALLDYFFRGEMRVSLAVPMIQDESVLAFLLVIKNVTPSEETMSDGNFAISVGCTPYGGNSDGSDDMFGRSEDTKRRIAVRLGDAPDVQSQGAGSDRPFRLSLPPVSHWPPVRRFKSPWTTSRSICPNTTKPITF